MKTTEKKEDSSRYIPNASPTLYRANLEAFGPEMAKHLKANPAVEIPIEDTIHFKGLKNPQYLVILGLATSRVYQEALKVKKEISHILIIEPHLGRFHSTMMREWLQPLLDDKKVDLVLGTPPEGLIPQLYTIFTQVDKSSGSRAAKAQHPEIIFDPFAYPDPNTDEAKALVKAVTDASTQTFTAMGCAADSFARWERMLQNIDNIGKAYKATPLFKKFKDVPCIVVGGGPSVKEFIDAYHKYDLANHACIIACDAVLRLLHENKVQPHFVTRCERKKTHIFKGVDRKVSGRSILVTYPWTHPDYWDLFDRRVAVFRSNGICGWAGVKGKGLDPGNVNGGVSAANAGAEFAAMLGSKSIVFTGIDLCFIDNKTHIEGTEVEFDPEKSKEAGKWQEITGNSGGTVTTIPVWFRCRNEYSGTISKYPDSRFYNTSLKGAKIDGAILKPWSELTTLWTKTHDAGLIINDNLDKHPKSSLKAIKRHRKETRGFLEGCLKDLDKLFLNVTDVYETAGREEQKLANQLKGFHDSGEFFAQVEQAKRALKPVYAESARQIDQFKKKYFTTEEFRLVVLDVTQLDFFVCENKINSLVNKEMPDHERVKAYIGLSISFLRLIEFYLKNLSKLFGGEWKNVNELPGELDVKWPGPI